MTTRTTGNPKAQTRKFAHPHRELGRIRWVQYAGAAMLFGGFVGALRDPKFGLLSLASLVLFGLAYVMIRRRIRCPQCGKNLGYLVINADYSRNNYAVLVCPRHLPADFRTCPECNCALGP